MASHRTCIICDKPAGSGEHIFPASLGGRRTNRGIYCGEHDNGFSPLVSALAYQLRMLNGQLEVVNDHRRREGFVAPEVEDADGVVHAIAGGAFIPQRSRVLARETDAQGREILQLAVPADQVGALHAMERRGDIEIRATGEPVTALAGAQRFSLMFGGATFLAGVAYIALSYFAKYHPHAARLASAHLVAMKAGLVAAAAAAKGGSEVPMPDSVWWETPDVLQRLPAPTFRFAHSIVIATNAATGRAGAYVCLFGVFCFGVDFGAFEGLTSRTVVVHLDPQAPSAPADQTEEDAVGIALRIAAPEGSPTDNLRRAIHDGTAERYVSLFQQRAEDWHVEQAADQVLAQLRAIAPGALGSAAGRQSVHAIIDGHNQRVYRMMCAFARFLPPSLVQGLPGDAGVQLAAVVAASVARDETKPSGLTDHAFAMLQLAKAALAEKIAREYAAGTLDTRRLKLLLGGGEGVAVVGRATMQPILGTFLDET